MNSKVKNQNDKSKFKIKTPTVHRTFAFCLLPLRKRGFAALATVIFVFAIIMSILTSLAFVSLREVKITRNATQSVRSLLAAEAGAEDAVYRIVTAKQITNGSVVGTGFATSTLSITTVGDQKTITATGLASNLYSRNLQVVIRQKTSEVGFNYGAQVGDGGISLGNGSSINGDVFSNGNITGAGDSKSTITGTAKVAGNSSIQNVTVNKDAYAYSFSNCTVKGTAFYVNSNVQNCTMTGTSQLSQGLGSLNFPITSNQIAGWENDAAGGGTLASYSISNNSTASLGPKKITGDLTLGNGSTLNVTGTLYIHGTVSFGNNDTIQLDSATYGTKGGLIIVDGSVSVGNGGTLKGTGQTGSYLVLLSNSSETAISIGNNATSSVFYAPNGTISIGNSLLLHQATGYGLSIGNSSSISYDLGVVSFGSGSTTWSVASWQEVP